MTVDASGALEGVLALFEEAPLVGLAEKHGIEQGAAFVEDLVRHPGFAGRVQTIAIELGNALHQDIADAYIAGDEVAPEELRRIWLDVVGAGPWGVRQPIYPRFFETVREVNRGLPPERRVRVVLGDPPLDWRTATREAVYEAASSRDAHLADVTSRALTGGGRVLLLAGDFHLFRRHLDDRIPVHRAGNVIQLLEARQPGSTRVVGALGASARPDAPPIAAMAALQARLAASPFPSLLRASDPWLGALPAAAVYGAHVIAMDEQGVAYDPALCSTRTLGELCDYYLYFGPNASLTWSPFDERPIDEADRAELARRETLYPNRGPAVPDVLD